MIHFNIGSNLNSNFGDKFKNISIAIKLLINSKLKIKKISSFYATPSYPNKKNPQNSKRTKAVNQKDYIPAWTRHPGPLKIPKHVQTPSKKTNDPSARPQTVLS